MAEIELNLEKFGSIGGGYFEAMVALALDELGYVEGKTYVPSWAKKCVPGTWIEADFIISSPKDKTDDPVNNGRIVFAIGHATSENSAGMKFHRDVEQLLEVKALPNGAEYRVADILFCCPRETMGGWSKELVDINEAIFDDSIIVWKHEWGQKLLFHIQQVADRLTDGTNEVKKERLKTLIGADKSFRGAFQDLRGHIDTLLKAKMSKSKIQAMFVAERAVRSERLSRELLIKEPRETDFKRGLLQVLALNEWELELLYESHQRNKSGRCSLEKLAYEKGLSCEQFDEWWERLELLSVKLGSLKNEVETPGEELMEDSVRWFNASEQLAYVLEHFDLDALKSVSTSIQSVAPNLVPYIVDLRDLSRAQVVMDKVVCKLDKFVELCVECYENDPWLGIEMPRLLALEVAKSAVTTSDRRYSYDVLANESGNQKLIKYPGFFRGIHPGKRGNPKSEEFLAGCKSLFHRVQAIGTEYFKTNRPVILKRFVYDRLDGMVKQPKESVLDALIDAEVKTFAKGLKATVTSATTQGLPSAFNAYAGGGAVGVNVEVPYVLIMPDKRQLIVHRVNANDGHSADKRKEFSSKIRSIRYVADAKGQITPNKNLAGAILVVDGNWTRTETDDWQSHIRMLTVAGWDFVVFPDQLSEAFDGMKAMLSSKKKTK